MPKTAHDAITLAALAASLVLMLVGPGLAVAALGGALYLAAATRAPVLGLGGVVASLPFYLLPRQLGGLTVSLPETTLLLCTLAVGLRTILDRSRGGPVSLASLTLGPYGAPITLFLAGAMLSLLVTEYLRLSLRELRTLIVEPVLFFYLTRHVTGSGDSGDVFLLDVLLAATTVVALIAIAQFVVGGAVTEVQGVRRVQGTYTSPNHLGLLLGRVVPFLVAGAWLLPRQRLPHLAGAAVCLAALALTFSLGAWLGTAAALVLLAALLAGPRGLAVASVAVVVLGLVTLFGLRPERVLAHLDPSQGTSFVRIQLWEAALKLMAEQPILGIGLDNFLYRYPWQLPSGAMMEPNLSHPHNLVLQLWLQVGLIGLAGFLWLIAIFFKRTYPNTRTDMPPRQRALAAGALGSMTDFLVHGMIDNSYFLVDTAFIFWLTLALSEQSADKHEPSAVFAFHEPAAPQ